jgi:hypothetical protein
VCPVIKNGIREGLENRKSNLDWQKATKNPDEKAKEKPNVKIKR